MKQNIHPQQHLITIKCVSCHNEFQTMSTKTGQELVIDICSKCHPFFIGAKQGTVAIKGRAEKLSSKFESGKVTISTKPIKSVQKVKKTNNKEIISSFEELAKKS